MIFSEAYKLMLQGHKIRRPCFKGHWSMDPEQGICKVNLGDGHEIQYGKLDITIRNCAATDWEVIEDEPASEQK